MVWLNGEHTLLLVQIQDITVQISILRIVYCVIKQGNVSLRLDMLTRSSLENQQYNHVIGCDYHSNGMMSIS